MMVSRRQRLALRLLLGLGLYLLRGAPCLAERDGESITFCKDIAPILWKHCADCHRPGDVAPFSLLTYKDAVKRAKFLKTITHNRQMPPWKPEPGVHRFHDERRLS